MAGSAKAACDYLTAALPGRVISPNDAQYESERDFPWSQTCWLPAACYVRPATSAEVATTLKVVRETSSRFAIRCGGHNANPGFNSVDGSGIVIDLRDLKSISVDESSVARIGAGNTWGQVYTFLEGRGLAAMGGRQNDVGVGGYLLGGGLPAFSNLHGLAADSIVNFEVVLSDSTIVNANEEENSDLYRALKGGGSNFGIVTRFDIQAYDVKAQYTLNVYNPADYANILRATVELQESMEKDPKIGMFVNFNPTAVAVGLFYADWVSETPEAFRAFFSLPSLISSVVPTTNGTMKGLVDAIGPTQPLRRQVYTASSKVSYEFYIDAHKHYLDMLKKHPDAGSLFYSIQPVSTTTAQLAAVRGGNTMGIEHVAQSWLAFVAEWSDPSNDAAGEQGVLELCSGIQTIGREQKQLLDIIFMNDAHGSQDVLNSYGSDNAKKLKETAYKYDPHEIFQKLQKDGFLVRKMGCK